MDDRIVWVIECFADEHWFEPAGHWPKYYFDQRAYGRWAVQEIIELLAKRGSKKPTRVVEEFVRTLDKCYSVRADTREMFRHAREAAEDVLDLLRAME